ncbi:FKBP-type peptidyl-prolyl cis-trans isomerase [Mucilaginibacter sp.]|uniref:FKBP-type peptidyl-prolyl cis-trans isomerase n=1 Tax=Mucilaginibacter sp. TaxID=1882438 RepID=UPI0035BBFE7D
MKQRIFTFLLIAAASFTACRKSQDADPNIKQYDELQIQGYMTANGLTDFKRDTTGGDTTGIHYKIINKGTGTPLEYSDLVSLVFTIKTFDGKYVSTDTITNHIYNYLGHLAPSKGVTTSANLPLGLQLGIKTILKYKDGSMRLLIPSRLAYGRAGIQKGSVTNINTNIAGNQSLDYYVHVIDDQQVYDDLVMRNYMTANSLTGYSKTASGIYYKIIKDKVAGSFINDNSTVSATYITYILNNTQVDNQSATTAFTFAPGSGSGVAELTTGIREILTTYGGTGSSLSMLVPSRLAYGRSGSSTGAIPSNAPIRFDTQIVTVTN